MKNNERKFPHPHPHSHTSHLFTTNNLRPAGLENIGNTCYLNSLLQFLFTIKDVRDFALQIDPESLQAPSENLMDCSVPPNFGVEGLNSERNRKERLTSQSVAKSRQCKIFFFKVGCSDGDGDVGS